MAALFFAYPLLAHMATLLHSRWLSWAALTVFFAVPMLPALRRRSPSAWLWLTVIVAILTVCAWSGIAQFLMYLPPILIPLSVGALFYRSLQPGQLPIVSRVAKQLRGDLPDELITYTRRVTQMWVGFMGLMALGSLLLALFATPALWSLMTNVVQYGLIAAMFAVEYVVRRWRFSHLKHERFDQLVIGLFKIRLH